MPDRKRLVSTIWLAASLVMLASLLVAPIRTPGLVSASSRPDGIRRDFALPPGQPMAHLGPVTAGDAILEMNALPSEVEEQDRADAPDELRVCFLMPCFSRKVPDRQSIAPHSIPSLYPLRC